MGEITTLPPKTDPRWRDLANGTLVRPWQTLALKIMMMRITGMVKNDPSPATLQKAIDEIYAFFEKNMKIAQPDLQSLFG
jgi:hypothetical protein